MTVEQANRLLGNQSTRAIANMRKALELHPWHNTPDDWQRYEAAQVVLRHRKYRDARRAAHTMGNA